MIGALLVRTWLKLAYWQRALAVRHTRTIRSVEGFEGVVRLLQTLEGADAGTVLRANGADIGTSTRLSRGLVVHNADDCFCNLHIGNNCHLGREVFLDLANRVQIGDRVTISMRTTILTHTNVGDSRCGIVPSVKPIEIENDVYIGAGVLVLPGVKLGAGSIIAAGAVVARDVEPNARVAGCPARPIASNRN